MSQLYDHVLCIDPGASGALVIRRASFGDDHRGITVHPFNHGEGLTGLWSYRDSVAKLAHRPVALIERVWASPAMGQSQSFAFGENYGLWQGALRALGIPVFCVTPQQWQRNLAITVSGNERKKALKEAASDLFPSLKVTLTNCDALLLSQYAIDIINTNKPLGEPL